MAVASDKRPRIQPQAGAQEKFLRSRADIAIYAGARFAGKTYTLSMNSMVYIEDLTYSGAIFRRTYPRMMASGNIWDTSVLLSRYCGGKPTTSPTLQVTYPSKAKVQFLHCENENDKYNYLGSQFTFLGFDQIEEFTESQFWFLWTCNRSGLGCTKRPLCRATCNPVPRPHWLRELLDWWIDPNTGYPIPERSGVLRWFTRSRQTDKIEWVEKNWRGLAGEKPKSLTFVAATIDDNPLGQEANPEYKATLEATDKVTRERYRYGNWNIVESAGLFEERWFRIVDEAPATMIEFRMWDRAATVPSEKNPDPDWTAGPRGGLLGDVLYIKDVQHFRVTPAENEKRILDTADIDGRGVTVAIEQEPGSAGKDTIDRYRELLQSYSMISERPVGKKEDRAKSLSAHAEQGKVCLLRGTWNQEFLSEATQYPNGKKDQIDASTALLSLCRRMARVISSFNLDKHVKKFEIEKLVPEKTVCIMCLRLTATLEVVALFCVWDAQAGRLYVIDEKIMAQADTVETAGFTKTIFQGCPVRVYADDEFFSGKRVVKPLAWLFRKAGIRVRQNRAYEEKAAVEMLNDLLDLDDPAAVVIADHCITLRRQMLEWLLDKQVSTGANVDAVRCLLMAMSVLVKEPPPAPIVVKWRGYSRLAKEWSKARKGAAENGTLAEFMMSGGPVGAQTDGMEK